MHNSGCQSDEFILISFNCRYVSFDRYEHETMHLERSFPPWAAVLLQKRIFRPICHVVPSQGNQCGGRWSLRMEALMNDLEYDHGGGAVTWVRSLELHSCTRAWFQTICALLYSVTGERTTRGAARCLNSNAIWNWLSRSSLYSKCNVFL